MTALIELPPVGTQPEPWDRAAAPPDAPFAIQERAIEELLQEAPLLTPLYEAPLDFALVDARETTAPTREPDPFVEEFKPTADEWENVKEILRPHPGAVALDEDRHPAYKPEFLERDGEGVEGGGDWNEVETERTKT